MLLKLAEKEGFEPPEPFPAQLISSQSHSATLALLLKENEMKRLERCFASVDWLDLPFRCNDIVLNPAGERHRAFKRAQFRYLDLEVAQSRFQIIAKAWVVGE